MFGGEEPWLGEAQEVPTLAVLAEDPDSVHSTHMAAHSYLYLQFQGSETLF